MNKKIINNIIDLYKNIHNENLSIKDILEDINSQYEWDKNEVLNYLLDILYKEYGFYVSFCSPFDNNDNTMIQKIILDDKKPILGIISDDYLSYFKKYELVKLIYPDIIIIEITKNLNEQILKLKEHNIDASKIILYTFNDINHADISIKKIKKQSCLPFENINSDEIKNDKEKAKNFIDARIYMNLNKEKFWKN